MKDMRAHLTAALDQLAAAITAHGGEQIGPPYVLVARAENDALCVFHFGVAPEKVPTVLRMAAKTMEAGPPDVEATA